MIIVEFLLTLFYIFNVLLKEISMSKYSLFCSLLSFFALDIFSVNAKDCKPTSSFLDGFLNIKAAHERANQYPFGPKNASAIAANPVLKIGDFTIDSDFYYGKQFTYTGYCLGKRNLSRLTSASSYYYFFHDLNNMHQLQNQIKSKVSKGHFYRSYTRGVYNVKNHDFFIAMGDVFTNNTIGFQQTLRGGGISIARRSPGPENIVNAGLPIAITNLSKLECRLDGQIIAVVILPPGLYSVDDLPEEAKLPGVTLHISDQLSRSDDLKVDYFSGYALVEEGKNDFDIVLLYDHYYDLDDPFKLRYEKKPRYSANYRYGYNACTTIYCGVQGYSSKSIKLDYGTSFKTKLGLFSPAVSYSYDKDNSKKDSVGASIYYALPENDYGIYLEAFLAAKAKGYTNLGKDSVNDANAFIDKYFSNNIDRQNLYQTSSESSSRQVVTRVYTKPIYGFTPAFIFSGNWSSSSRIREYTLSLSKKFSFATITCSAGLTYDDPSGGRNQRAPDRRLTVACLIPLGKEVVVKGTYSYYNDETYRTYGDIEYRPSQIKGLTLSAEDTRRPGFNNPKFSVKYDGRYCNVKLEESIVNTYERRWANVNSTSHKNQQRAFFGTSLSTKGLHGYRKNSFHVLRVDKDFEG